MSVNHFVARRRAAAPGFLVQFGLFGGLFLNGFASDVSLLLGLSSPVMFGGRV